MMAAYTIKSVLLRAEIKPVKRYQPGRSRIFVRTTPEFPEPEGPLCSDPECVNCRATELRGGRPEVDHDIWRTQYFNPCKREAVTLAAEAFGREEWEKFGSVRWSKKAGCSMCPCSPGWVTERHGGFDYHVSLEVQR